MTITNVDPDFVLDIYTPKDNQLYHEMSTDYNSLYNVAKDYLSDRNLCMHIKDAFAVNYVIFDIDRVDADGSTTNILSFVEFLTGWSDNN